MNKQKGTEYEKLINSYRNTLADTKISYLWNDVPEQVLYDVDLITDYNKKRLERKNKNKDINDPLNTLQDIGIDIIDIDKNDNPTFIQCKNYENNIRIDDLCGFWMMMYYHQNTDGIVYHSNPGVSRNIIENMRNDKIKFIHKSTITAQQINKFIKLYDYQSEIVKLYTEYYKTNNKAVLSMPCGTGKTIISCFISKQYNVIIFISPLKQFAEQNMDRFKEYDKDRKCLLVDSDGTRDVDEIKAFIKDNKKTLISVTYKSCDIIVQLLDTLLNTFIIVDEFHNLSAKNIYGEKNDNDFDSEDYYLVDNNDPLNTIINSDHKILYMSATPRIYELEDNNDCDIEDNLGKVVYKMDFKTAIEKKYISDYNIYLPILTDESKTELDYVIKDIKKETKIKFTENKLAKQCCYLYECIKKFGTMKCIIYFQSHEDINKFIQCFNDINKYYCYDYNIDSITCNDNRKQRKEKIEKFKTETGHSFLCAVNILDECIDIKECNSIYITYNSASKVKNVQRMSRAMRLDSTNNNKIAKVILWCDELSEIVTFLSSIKEYDANYNQKVGYIKFHRNLVKTSKTEIADDNTKYGKHIVGVKEYRMESWEESKNKIDNFITINKKRPNKESKDKEERKLANWLCDSIVNYRDKNQIMSNDKIRKIWEEFIEKNKNYIVTKEQVWYKRLEEVIIFMDANVRRPNSQSKNIVEKKYGQWLVDQVDNHKNMNNSMKNENIYRKWAEFIVKYKTHFASKEEQWEISLENTKKYIDINNKRPSKESNDKYINKIGNWCTDQLKNYKNNSDIMKNEIIREKWDRFMAIYGEYFRSKEEQWVISANRVIKYIVENNKKPSKISKNIDIKYLGNWIDTQKYNYKNKKGTMKDPKILKKWLKMKLLYSDYL